jgi:hypothetical protein
MAAKVAKVAKVVPFSLQFSNISKFAVRIWSSTGIAPLNRDHVMWTPPLTSSMAPHR